MPSQNPTVIERREFSRRQLLRGALLAPLALSLNRCRSRLVEPGGFPNIVVLVADSLRAASLPMYGHRRNTAPFLNQLAQRSTVFSRCYSSATWTRPAVTSLLSGLPPLLHRQWAFNKAFPLDLPSFPQALRELGFHTGFFTANHAIGEGFGMEEHFDHVSFEAATDNDFGHRLTEDCATWLAELPPGPVFAYVHYFPPHGPYDPPVEFVERIRRLSRDDQGRSPDCREVEISLGNASSGRIPWYQAIPHFSRDPVHYCDRYDASVLFADSLLAHFFERWEALRPGERTVFVATSDHGECLHEHERWFDHGRTLANQILHVPLLVFDNDDPAGRVIDSPVSHLDLGTTLLHLAGSDRRIGPLSDDILGQGLSDRAARRVLVSQEGVEGHESGWAITRGRWRLTYNDCPRDGLMDILSVDATSGATSGAAAANRRVPLPRPATVSHGPLTMAPGIVLRELALDADLVAEGRQHSLRGVIVKSKPSEGMLHLRCTMPGRKTVALGSYPASAERSEVTAILSPFDPTPDLLARPVSIEARWIAADPAADAMGRPPAWRTVLVFPLLSPRPMNADITLLGATITPAGAAPGDSVKVTYWWKTSSPPSKHTQVVARLIDPSGTVVVENDHPFLQPSSTARAGMIPLIEQWRLRDYSFTDRSFRFEESFWLQLPHSLQPGLLKLHVGLQELSSPSAAPTEGSVPEAIAAELVVARGPWRACEATLQSGWGLEHLRMLPEAGWRAAPAEAGGVLSHLHEKYPEEGEIDFRLAAGRDADGRDRLLRSCLIKTPRHRRALEVLDELGSVALPGTAVECDFRFAGLLHLHGFSLLRCPDDPSRLALTLFWDSLARTNDAHSGEISVQTSDATGRTRSKSAWWFLGGRIRPTCERKIGETVVETVLLPPMPDDAERAVLTLRVTERWAKIYSNDRYEVVLPCYQESDPAGSGARLGSFELAQVAVAEHDLVRRKRRNPDQFHLFELSSDPGETENLVYSRPEVFGILRADLEMLMEGLSDQVPQAEGEDIVLPEETRQKLRALGYIA